MSKVNRNSQAAEDFREGSSVLPPSTEAVRKAVIDVLSPIRRLSFFERRTADALGKSYDSHGNLDLNEAANTANGGMHGTRINPNVLASQSDPLVLNQTAKAQRVAEKSKCAQNCQDSQGRDRQGRTSCPLCKGAGYNAHQKSVSNQARTLFPGQS